MFLVLAAIVALASLLGGLSGFYIDLLWFREVGFSTVFWSVLWTRVLLGVVFGITFFAILALNLLIAQRIAPRFRAFSPEQEVIERYRAAIEPHARWVILGFSALIALFVGLAASGQWETFLLWRSVGDVSFVGQADPLFARNPAFYIFVLPFHKFLQGWLFSALVGVTLLVGVAHYLSGGIRTQAAGEKVMPQVKAHLSVLLGLIVLVKAWGYYLGRFDLLVSPRGVVTGASYTDIHAQLPALKLLVFIAIACALLFLVNIRFRGWALPVLGIGLLALTSVVAGAIFPTAVQSFSVNPQELQREAPFIDRNIAATRFAFGLEDVDLRQEEDVGEGVTAEQVEANQATVENIRLWSPPILADAYLQLQRVQPYYEFVDVDVDRYEIDGERRVVMLSPREIDQTGIPGGGNTWQNRHLVYTHGLGAAASQVNSVTPEGAPDFVLQDVPPRGEPGIALGSDEGAQLYYGELSEVPYVVVGGSGQRELNYPNPAGQRVSNRYAGQGGISIGGFFRQLLFAYRYRDINLLISGLIDEQSKILIYRDVEERIRKSAPFLRYDRDPYAAIIDGRIVFIQDAYTTTDRYPYSQHLDLTEATSGDLAGRTNYIRNSVKAVVDAYDGTVTFYVVDPGDPLIQVWMRAFPDLFTDGSLASDELRAHFRYPEDLLQVQAEQFSNYHVTNAETFYGRELFWARPNALSTTPAARPVDEPGRPYYVLLKLPQDSDEEFVLFQPLTPADRPNMVAYLAARSDPENYGELTAVEFTGNETVDGPQQARARIDNDPNLAREISLLDVQGSLVKLGDLLVVPIENSFLYVQPIFVESAQQNAIPELKRVAVVNGGRVGLGDTLAEAVQASFLVAPPTEPPPEEPPPTDPPSNDVAALLAEADRHFDLAQQALIAGDLATYQSEINLGIELVQQANALTSGTPPPSPSAPSATPSASPTG
ncbi:UPF0182 family protein [soil metagenome]